MEGDVDRLDEEIGAAEHVEELLDDGVHVALQPWFMSPQYGPVRNGTQDPQPSIA